MADSLSKICIQYTILHEAFSIQKNQIIHYCHAFLSELLYSITWFYYAIKLSSINSPSDTQDHQCKIIQNNVWVIFLKLAYLKSLWFSKIGEDAHKCRDLNLRIFILLLVLSVGTPKLLDSLF